MIIDGRGSSLANDAERRHGLDGRGFSAAVAEVDEWVGRAQLRT